MNPVTFLVEVDVLPDAFCATQEPSLRPGPRPCAGRQGASAGLAASASDDGWADHCTVAESLCSRARF